MQDYASVDENLCPLFRRMTDGSDEVYDTLDNVDIEDVSTVEELYKQIMGPLVGTVGVVVTGVSEMSDPSYGYWGRALIMCTGERLQMRILPRGAYHRVPVYEESRMIAVRRTSHGRAPNVGFAVLYRPRSVMSIDVSKTPLANGRTIGCRGVHLILPSLFRKHDPHHRKGKGHAQLDQQGFHSIRPSTLMVSVNTPRSVKESQIRSFSMTSGDAYLVMAGHMAGVDIPDVMTRASSVVTDANHSRHIVAKQRRITNAIGEAQTARYVASALTLCELLCAEGVLSIMCNSFFAGAQPDMLFSPSGVPLCIVMAVHIACNSERFGLPSCTTQDTQVNLDMMRSFNSRWGAVMLNGFRALDVAIKSAHDNATTQCNSDNEAKAHVEDNMKFWQRIGQRTIAKLMSNPSDEVPGGIASACVTRFGTADSILDPITTCKYNELEKMGFNLSIKETAIDKVFLAPRCDIRTMMALVQDNIETWLRTGMFAQHRLSKANVNVASTPSNRPGGNAPGLDPSSSTDSDDDDDILDNKVCIDAMESAVGAMAAAMTRGPCVMNQLGLQCFLATDNCSNKCADCEQTVSVYEGTLFATNVSECRNCNRKRCFTCTKTSLLKRDSDFCLRCAPGAPSVMHTIAPNARRVANASSKKTCK